MLLCRKQMDTLHTYINDPTVLTSVDFTLSPWQWWIGLLHLQQLLRPRVAKQLISKWPWQCTHDSDKNILRLYHPTSVNDKTWTQQRYSEYRQTYLGMDEGWMDSALMMCLCSRASSRLKQTGSVLGVTPLPKHVFLPSITCRCILYRSI